jgi:hypothetical protein
VTPRLLCAVSTLLTTGAAGATALEQCHTAPYDVVVYGGTSSGVIAAVKVARMGKSVVLIEPGRHLGGLSSGGLGATDIGNKDAIGGMAREFYRRVGAVYGADEAWSFEPHVAERIFNALIREANVPVVLGERLGLSGGVRKKGARIVAIAMESGRTFRGRMFIDASYEGDLMAKAGVSYHVGREANEVYGETLNGVQTRNAVHHQFIKPVDPYVVPGDPASGLLPGVHADGPGAEGSGDHRVQAYNFRMCTTDVPENRRPWPKPADYDPLRYELLLRNFEAGDHRVPWHAVMMPNRKTDTNNNHAVSTDYIGMNYEYPDGDYATRERIIREHESYQKGLMWTLANSPRVPEEVRGHFQTWGLAKDEFTDNDNWPHQLYVREARRMVAEYVMTEHNCRGERVAEDSVGLAAYTMDSHNVQRYVDEEGHVRNEGDVQVGGFTPYPISYRAIVPKRAECTNLLIPVCLSASHIAFGSIRMEPVFMVLGESAATAAVQALDADVDVQAIKYDKLAERLIADGQILHWRSAGVLDPKQLDGIVIDDGQAEFTGAWVYSNSITPFVGAGYRHDDDKRDGTCTAQFTTRLPASGRYQVRLFYSAHFNRATNVPVTVRHADGTTTVHVDQTQAPAGKQGCVPLGTYRFEAGEPACVTISNRGTDGHVVVDAVQFVRSD